LLITFVLFLLYQVSRLQEASFWIDHTDQVIQAAQEARSVVIDAETGVRGFLLTEKTEFLEPYEQATKRVTPAFDNLIAIVSDNPAQVARAKKIHSDFESWVALAQTPLSLQRSGGDYKEFVRSGNLKAIMDSIRSQITTFIQIENDLRIQRNIATERVSEFAYLSALLLSVALGCFFAFYTSRQFVLINKSYRVTKEQLESTNATLEATIAERTRELQETNQDLQAFTYSVSHDLRAPLRSIEGFSQALISLLGDSLNERAKHYVDRICAATIRMGKLIDDLLSLSRITRSRAPTRIVDLSALAKNVVEEIQGTSAGSSAKVLIAPSLNTQGDPDLIRVLLTNLFSNAIKYSSKKQQPEIEFAKASTGIDGVFFVRDNGVGFDMRYKDKLFLPFERLHSDEEFEGTGIGLAIAKKVIDRHDGKIWAES
jgi:signal transduction histidine kinase